MAARDGFRIDDARAVGLRYLGWPGPAVSADAAGRAPQQKNGTRDLPPRFEVFGIHLEIDTGRSAIVLADGVDGRGIAEASFVFRQCFGIEKAQALFGFCKFLFDEPVGVGAHHPFWQIVWLDIEEPMPGERGPLLVDVIVQMMLRNNVEDCRAQDLFRMIQAHSMQNAGATVVAGSVEAIETK